MTNPADLPDLTQLLAPITSGTLSLTQLAEADREAMRAICPADDAVWDIYSIRFAGPDFDREFDAVLANPGRCPFALREGGALVGMSGYLNIDRRNRALEIGGTYMTPSARGTGLNGRIKPLLIERAIACGFHRLEFLIDVRNLRSQRAVEKLGAVREGVIRRERITWTGHVRDTALYSILPEEWAEKQAREGAA